MIEPRLLADAASLTAAPAVLLPYQQRWIADDSQLKVSEKSRRVGLTWAEASDNVLIAASDKPAGGQNVYYIGYNQDMAIEYIEACAMWARVFDRAAGEVEEGIWEDGDPDKHIKTYTIRFPGSGHRIVALSSRPANLRGKQGVVVIDEAAFHDQLDELLKAALALLIWGGRVRVLSTHNGEQNPFNQLINDIRSGQRKGSVQRIEFQEAVQQGLYERVCLRRGVPWRQAEQDAWVADVYAFYGEAAREELDVIPSAGSGAFLTRAMVESVMEADRPVVRLALPTGFEQLARHLREAEVRDWCERELLPLLELLDPERRHYYGLDFARVADLTVLYPLMETPTLQYEAPFAVELRNVPYQQQEQILFYLVDRLPRFTAAAHDATGNGGFLAEVAMQRYGASRIAQIKLSVEWYREHMPRMRQLFEDQALRLPKDSEHLDDLRAVRKVDGVAQVPKNARSKDHQGAQRHGDAAIALALAIYAVFSMEPAPIEFTPVPSRSSRWEPGNDDDDHHDFGGKAGW